MQLWDPDNSFPGLTASYCRTACGSTPCDECPRPRLLPDALFAVLVYGAVQTQWNYSPRGAPLGLRYEGCLPVLERKREHWAGQGVPDAPGAETLFEDLRVIEAAFIVAHGERSKSAEVPSHG